MTPEQIERRLTSLKHQLDQIRTKIGLEGLALAKLAERHAPPFRISAHVKAMEELADHMNIVEGQFDALSQIQTQLELKDAA